MRTLCFLAVALAFSSVACKKSSGDATGGKGDKTTKDKSGEGDDEAPKAKGGKGCKLPEGDIKADWTIPAGCALKVKEHIRIDGGATLTLGAGAKLSMSPGSEIYVENGKIVAKGTEDEPVVFTSANGSPAAGDWGGIFFGGDTMAGTTLDHVVIEYAGKQGGHGEAAIIVYGDVGASRIALTNSTLRKNAHAALHNIHPKSKFAKLEGNVFKDNDKASLVLHPEVLGSVGSNKFGDPIRLLDGDVETSATWPKLDVPLLVDGILAIAGKGKAATVTLADKTVFKVVGGRAIFIGRGDGGGFIGKGTKFTSANDSPAAGDWEGLFIEPGAKNTTLEDCTVEYAGKQGLGKAAVVFYETEPKKLKTVSFKGCTFRKNEHGAFQSNTGDCGTLPDDNKVEGTACVKD